MNAAIGQLKNVVVINFVVTLIGCLAPLTLIFGLAYLLPRREMLNKCGPIFVILGWISIGLSSLYCLLFIIFVLVSYL